MADATKDWGYYLDHPEEMGELTVETMAELTASYSEGGPAGATPPPVADSTVKVDVTETSSSAAPAKGQEGKPDIQLKDGVHTLPYRVLEDERTAREAAETRLAEMQAALAAKDTEIASLKAGGEKGTQTTDTPELFTDEELAELKKDAPVLGKAIESMQKQLKTANETITTLSTKQQAIDTERQAEIKVQQQELGDLVEAAILATPKLLHLRDTVKGEAWDNAVEIDTRLRKRPEWRDEPFEKRFAKVVELYETEFGAIAAPAATHQPSKEDLERKAREKLDQSQGGVPGSLSDVPGASAPTTDEREKLENMTVDQIARDMFKRTPEQIEAFVATL